MTLKRKPRILLLVDSKGWAYDNCAQQIARQLRTDFTFDIRYIHEQPKLTATDYDLIYVFYWGEKYHHRFGFDRERTLKEVSSHRWEDNQNYAPYTAAEMAANFLGDAATVICTSRRLFEAIRPHHSRVFHAPNGVDPTMFKVVRKRSGPMTIGWAGSITDRCKGVNDILKPACGERFNLLTASGISHAKMNRFYNRLDVITVASTFEGSPLPLLEAMAAGCFPVCTDVGIVPEIVRNGKTGLIVKDRSPQGFRAAFEWCEANLAFMRKAGAKNAALIARKRNWPACAPFFKRALMAALNHARND